MLLLLLGVLALVMTVVRLPYVAFRPGSVSALTDRIAVTVGERFQPAGDVFFTTVRQDTRVNGWEYLEANIDESGIPRPPQAYVAPQSGGGDQ